MEICSVYTAPCTLRVPLSSKCALCGCSLQACAHHLALLLEMVALCEVTNPFKKHIPLEFCTAAPAAASASS